MEALTRKVARSGFGRPINFSRSRWLSMGAEPTAKGKSNYGRGISRGQRSFSLPRQAATQTVPGRQPRVGELVQVRSRRWLVDEVIEPKSPGQTLLIRLSCADDDAQGNRLEVIWDYELDRLILEEEGWADLASKGFDQPRQIAAFLPAETRRGSLSWPEI